MGEGEADEIENEGEVFLGKLESALMMSMPCHCGSAPIDWSSPRVFPLWLVVALERDPGQRKKPRSVMGPAVLDYQFSNVAPQLLLMAPMTAHRSAGGV